jgi:hypothetical protein
VPGPSPWYLVSNAPELSGYEWKKAGDTQAAGGITLLVGPAGPVLALDFYNYAMRVSATLLLVWHQRQLPEGQSAPIDLRLFDCQKLNPLLGSPEDLCTLLRAVKRPSLYQGTVVCEVSIPTTIVGEQRSLAFPDALKDLGSF